MSTKVVDLVKKKLEKKMEKLKKEHGYLSTSMFTKKELEQIKNDN